MPRSVVSLDTASDSGDSYDSDEELRLAQEEWEESMQQLSQLLSIVLLPFFGKWLGRRWSHWGAHKVIFILRNHNFDCFLLSKLLRVIYASDLGNPSFLGRGPSHRPRDMVSLPSVMSFYALRVSLPYLLRDPGPLLTLFTTSESDPEGTNAILSKSFTNSLASSHSFLCINPTSRIYQVPLSGATLRSIISL